MVDFRVLTMNKTVKMLAIVGVLCVPLCASGADWPHFRGPSSNGFSPETGLNKAWKEKAPESLWQVAMGDGGFAGPCVAGGKVFIIDHRDNNDVVRALTLADGKPVWEYTYEEKGKADHGRARSTPTFEDGKLYTVSQSGIVNCLDARNGQKVWSRNIVADFKGKLPTWQVAFSPVIDGERLIVLPGGPDACVAVLEKASGKTVWQGGGSDVPSYATPVIATLNGKKQYIIFTSAGINGVDAGKGQLLWSQPWQTQHHVNAAAPLPVDNDKVFITSGYGHGCALLQVTENKAKILWENKEIQAHFSSSIFHEGRIYGTGDPGVLACLDAETGKVVWKHDGFEKGGIIAVDGTIIGLDGKGGDAIMVELSPKEYKELGRFKPLGGQSWTAPVVADGKLIVRNTKALACFKLK